MKKVLLFTMAVLAMVACKSKDEPTSGGGGTTAITLSRQSAQIKVGETLQLTVTPAGTTVTWSSNHPEFASVDASGLVTGVAKGNAIITATAAGSEPATCVVAVTEAGGGGGGVALVGSKIWPVIMDGVTSEANQSKIVFDYRPDDVNKFFYIWEGTYVGATATGKNFYGTSSSGDYTALTVTSLGWAGGGFCMIKDGTDPTIYTSLAALVDSMVANPSDYYLHMAIKSTDNYSHCFYFLGSEATKFVLGSKSVYDGPVLQDFPRTGAWAEFNIPMANYTTALAAVKQAAAYSGMNIFVTLTEGTAGAALNLDAVYFYKK